jgi:hypothetical protein
MLGGATGGTFAVHIQEPTDPDGLRSRPLDGMRLAPSQQYELPFEVQLRKEGDPLDGWTSRAVWACDDGRSYYLRGIVPFAPPPGR